MVNVLMLVAARSMRGGERRGREWPRTHRLVRLPARLVLAPFTAPASRVASATRRAMAGRETRLRHGDTANKLLSRQRSAFSVQLQWLFHLIIDSK